MVKEGFHDLTTPEDGYINDLAADWYFQALHFDSGDFSEAGRSANELIDSRLIPKRYLRICAFTFLEQMDVCVDMDTSFDVWLDADDDIMVSELYSDGEY